MFKYILLFSYVSISVLLLALNWDVFTISIAFDAGFTTFSAMPFVVLQILGILTISVFVLVDWAVELKTEVKITKLEREILSLKKDAEIAVLKKQGTANVDVAEVETI